MAFSNLKKFTFTAPFPTNFTIPRDSLVFPHVTFYDSSYFGTNIWIARRKGTGAFTAIWGNMSVGLSPFVSGNNHVSYAFVPAGYTIYFQLNNTGLDTVELYVIELDSDEPNN